ERRPLPEAGGGEAPGWARRYPSPLHDLLGRWQSIDQEAERGAARLLGALWPDPDALQREIAAIQKKAETSSGELQERLRRREENLRARIQSPEPSPERMRRMAEKLGRAVEHAVLRVWLQRVRAALRDHVAHRLDFGLPEAWLDDAGVLRVLSAITQ